MHPDARRWNARYGARGADLRFDPDDTLTRLARHLPRTGHALELACGAGGNALWLAARGLRVSGLDVSIEGLRRARAEAMRRGLTVAWVNADACRVPFAGERFDLVVVTRFYERALFATLRQSVRVGGIVYYRTFNRLHLERNPRFNPRFVLEPGELLEAFAGFETIATDDGPRPREATSFLLARRPAAAPRPRATSRPRGGGMLG